MFIFNKREDTIVHSLYTCHYLSSNTQLKRYFWKPSFLKSEREGAASSPPSPLHLSTYPTTLILKTSILHPTTQIKNSLNFLFYSFFFLNLGKVSEHTEKEWTRREVKGRTKDIITQLYLLKIELWWMEIPTEQLSFSIQNSMICQSAFSLYPRKRSKNQGSSKLVDYQHKCEPSDFISFISPAKLELTLFSEY